MAIDSRVDAVERQYPEPSESPTGLVLTVAGLAVPHLEVLLKFVELLRGNLSAKGRRERAQAFLDLLRDQENLLETLGNKFDKLNIKLEDLAEAVQTAAWRDSEACNDNKRDRYLKIIGNAVRSEYQIDDLASFIRDVEQLGESDINALKVLNTVMNKDGDWPTGNSSLHPNIFIQRREELAAKVATALGQKAEFSVHAGPFSHEEGYSVCARLQGFGLAHEIQVSPRQVPVGDYCFRPSKRGIVLLKLLGENVPNWRHYFTLE